MRFDNFNWDYSISFLALALELYVLNSGKPRATQNLCNHSKANERYLIQILNHQSKSVIQQLSNS